MKQRSFNSTKITLRVVSALFTIIIASLLAVVPAPSALAQPAPTKPLGAPKSEKRWMFVWRDMTKPAEVDRMIARFPRARAAGYNGVAFSYKIPPSKAAELTRAAKENGLDLIAIVMGNAHDPNYVEGVPVKGALFVAGSGRAAFQAENPPRLVNGDFENVTGNHLLGWGFQDDEGVTTFADHTVVHGGKTALRMEEIGKNADRHCRVSQPITLQPFRQYHVSVWVKTENLRPADGEIKVLVPGPQPMLSFQTFHTEPTQDWKKYDIVFNSLDHTDARLYFGSWNGKSGKMWIDDLRIEEIGLVNVLRRPGCPVTVRGENGTSYEEGRDYEKIVDPNLRPWQAFHESPPVKLTPATRIKDGERLRVSYYHPLIVYEDRITACMSEPKLFDDWRAEVEQANALYHPAAFLMSHDELRVMNWCALCRSKKATPGQILAENVRKAARIIRDIRPDAEIWVWNDMFDPQHNAVDHFYAVNGSLKGSWEGLDPGIGIVNWYGRLQGKNSPFFADRGQRQILSGYYDSDESGAGIARWRENTKTVPGVVGAMYTTWEDKYDALETWAQKAWGRSRQAQPER